MLTKSQISKYADTAFKTEKGNLLLLAHWTDQEFDRFMVGDIGYHLGTIDAAEERKNDKGSKTGRSIFKIVYFNGKNPLVLDHDPMTWDVFTTGHLLNREGVLTDEELQSLSKLDGYFKGDYESSANVLLRTMLTQKGYDCIAYRNGYEGGYSVIAFYPDQIEIVQDIEETDATARVPEAVATELYYAGLNGARIETAVDLSTVQGEEMRRAVQAIYDRGAAERRELGTEQGVYRAGKGKVVNRTDHRAKAKTDVELLRKFARTHHLDVEIHEDGSIEGEAAYDVAAFKILIMLLVGRNKNGIVSPPNR